MSQQEPEEEKALTKDELNELEEQEKNAARRVELLFQGKDWGFPCGKLMWQWCFCPRQVKEGGTCCDSDHIAFFIFLIGFTACAILPISFSIEAAKKDGTTTSQFFITMAVAIGVLFWALYQWTIVLNLRQELAEIADAITKLRKATASITRSVDSADNIQQKLRLVNLVQMKTTLDLKKTVKRFDEWSDKMTQISTSNKKLTKLLTIKYKQIQTELKNQLIVSEMRILEQIYMNTQLKDDNKIGLNQKEFGMFISRLPSQYKEKFKNMKSNNFTDLDINGDRIISRNELYSLMYQFVSADVIIN